MLVYAKVPMGYTTIGGRRVYGKFFSYGRFGPTDIPYKLFIENREQLEEVEYTSDILEKKFGTKFPPVSFKLSKLNLIDFDVLIKIAHCLGIKYNKGRQKPGLRYKMALAKGILSKITN